MIVRLKKNTKANILRGFVIKAQTAVGCLLDLCSSISGLSGVVGREYTILPRPKIYMDYLT